MLFPGHVRWSLRVNEGAPHSSCLRCLPFKKEKEKKCCGIFVSLFCFSLFFFLKKNTFKGAGGWWRRHNVTTRELWIQCSSGFATVSFVSIAAIFCDKLLEHYFTCDFRLWYFCFSSLHAIAAYSFVRTPWCQKFLCIPRLVIFGWRHKVKS